LEGESLVLFHVEFEENQKSLSHDVGDPAEIRTATPTSPVDFLVCPFDMGIP
jgi:hypothetical protein